VQLTDGHRSAWRAGARVELPAPWAAALVVIGMGAVFAVDRATGAVPFQHLYYLPIIYAAHRFGWAGGWTSSAAAVVLYHLANPALLAFAHGERDIVQIVLFLVVGVVMARLRDDARRLEALAATDDLTGLLNLRAFEQRLRPAVASARATGAPLSMLVLDLDGLKAINDVHGHLTGAEAVRTVGHVIAGHAPADAFACRYGGDEFIVALPAAPVARAVDLGGAILQAVRASAPVLAGQPFPAGTLSVSIGVAGLPDTLAPEPLDDAAADAVGEALFRAADAALYEAKRGGRGRVFGA
jgi:diguanylate cyclase (GGDEF)-like protein